MGLSRLAAKCRACPYVSTCNHKQMEALGYLPLPEPAVEIQVDRTIQIQVDRTIQIDNLLQSLNCCYTNMRPGFSKSKNNN